MTVQMATRLTLRTFEHKKRKVTNTAYIRKDKLIPLYKYTPVVIIVKSDYMYSLKLSERAPWDIVMNKRSNVT